MLNQHNDIKTVVWLHRDAINRDKSLKYSMRAFHENNPQDVECLICGDVPTWYEGQMIYSPPVPQRQCRELGVPLLYRPWLDVIHKLQKIVVSDRVSDQFLLFFNDVFLIHPIEELSLFTFPVANDQHLDNELTLKNANNPFHQLKKKTFQLLLDHNKPTRDYDCHSPVVLDKQCVLDVIDIYNLDKDPALFYSCYMNHWFDTESEYMPPVVSERLLHLSSCPPLDKPDLPPLLSAKWFRSDWVAAFECRFDEPAPWEAP